MGNYGRFFRHEKYSLAELMHQLNAVRNTYDDVQYTVKKGILTIILHLKPTDNSVVYTVKMIGRVGSTSVKIFVVDPNIKNYMNGKKVPHKYPDGSLCLYYNVEKTELKPDDLWSETLVPWISLWLYYYEKWEQTGEWLGGGVH